MNHHQLKQTFQNNLWYGENVRLRSADTPRLTGALIQPDYNRVWGVDVSGRWDGIVNFAVTKALGASFAFIKGVDGAIPTRYYKENYNKAVEVHLPCGPYAWLYRDVNVKCTAQAQALHDLNQKYPPQLPSVIDFEATKYGGVQSNPNFSDLDKWVTEWLRLGNPEPLLYSGKYYMNDYGPGRIGENLKAKLAGLFIAAYGTNNPGLPLGWSEYEYHQFSAEGDAQLIAPGNLGKIELDLDYAARAILPPPDNGGIPMDKYMKVTDAVTQSLNVRSSGENLGAQNDLGSFNLLRGDIIHVVESKPNNYQRFVALYRENVSVVMPTSPTGQYWSLEKDSSGVWLVDTTYTPPGGESSLALELATGSKYKLTVNGVVKAEGTV